ncbi:MAG: D-aminoacylase [Candidatus Bathyarchaeota archaeon]|nr:MAG: D-aminoacylase [Candidatus Bathyarchaeota archaeon]
MFDLVIRNCRILDGTGNPWQRGDIGVSGGKIEKIGLIGNEGDRVIDASGLMVAPGFIDTHSHSDLMLMAEPEAPQKVMQGITTEIVGQDGLGEAPIREHLIAEWRRYLSGLNGDPDIDWTWRSFKDYLDALDSANTSTNVAALVGHGNLRLLAIGMENRTPKDSELDEMKAFLVDSMKEGAFGLSTGLIYPPCVYADTEELTELCKVTASYGGVFAVHMRNEGDRLLESIDEVIKIGRDSQVPVHISHFKASGEQNWGKVASALEKLEDARSNGVAVTVDQYPYIAGSTFLSSLLPVWAHEDGTERMLSRLRDGTMRKRISDELQRKGRGIDWGWGNVMVTSVRSERNKPFEGLNLLQIAKQRGGTAMEALFDIILEEENAATMVSFIMSEEDVATVMRSPLQMVCTDGIVLGKPHPRAYGSFPRVLGRYVKKGVLRLEEAIRKMTYLPAQTFGFHDRGLLRPGMCADITVFNPGTITDTATYTDPEQYPIGIEHVIVNGEITVEAGKHTGKRAGQVLRHTSNRELKPL